MRLGEVQFSEGKTQRAEILSKVAHRAHKNITVVPISSALGEDPQEEGNNLRNGDLVGNAEMGGG